MTTANVVPLKRLAAVMPSNVDKHSVEGERAVRLCNYVDVYKNERITEALDFMEATATDAQIDRFTLKANDVIVTKDSEEPTDIGIPAHVPQDLPGVVCGYHLAVLRPDHAQLNGGYLHWALQSAEVHAYYATAATGISRYALGVQDIGMTPIHAPSVPEQERIANFLDEQTARIDALIAEKERLDSLLSEYRQSLISEAVTGRLNVDAPDAHSRSGGADEGGADVRPLTVRLRHRVEELKTGPFGSALSADEYVDDGVPLVNPSDLRAGRIWPDGAVKVPEEVAAQLAAYRLCDGDLVLGRRGELGRYGLVGPNEAGYLCGTGSLLVRPGASLAAKFLGYYLETPEARDWLSLQSVGSTMENLSEGILARLPIPDRSLREQLEIVNFLDEQTARIDALKNHVKEHIALLREYRSSLISAAVTGQLDISTFKPH